MCWRKLKTIQIFLGRSSQEMKLGFSNTILKQRGKVCSERLQNHPDPRRHCISKSKIKVMLIFFFFFFDQKGMVHHEFVPEGEAVNQHFYQQVLICLHNRIQRSSQELCSDKSWLLHHGNAPARKAISVRQLLVKKQIRALDHPPYSPDLAPCDFWLFPRLKAVMKGTHFSSLYEKQRHGS